MKKHVLLFFAILIVTSLSAQGDFGGKGSKWWYGVYNIGWSPSYSITPAFVEHTGVKDIDGVLCNELTASGVDLDLYPEKLYLHQIGNKVYWRANGTSHILYDFDLNAGDVYSVELPREIGSSQLIQYDLRIDSLKTIIIDGISLKVQYFSYLDGRYTENFGYKNTERMGNDHFLFPMIPAWDTPRTEFRCYEDNVINAHYVSYPCDTTFLASQDIIVDSDIKLYPNPVTDKLKVDIGPDGHLPEYAEAYNVVGQLQPTSLNYTDTGIEINTTRLSEGVYFLRIGHHTSDKVSIMKFVK